MTAVFTYSNVWCDDVATNLCFTEKKNDLLVFVSWSPGTVDK